MYQISAFNSGSLFGIPCNISVEFYEKNMVLSKEMIGRDNLGIILHYKDGTNGEAHREQAKAKIEPIRTPSFNYRYGFIIFYNEGIKLELITDVEFSFEGMPATHG